MSEYILIKNGLVIDPYNNIEAILDILIKDDKIIEVEKNISNDEATIIDATDKWVVPGLIDLHVHLRDPGLTYKEDIITGSNSAKSGGFTTICAMPNTLPVTDNVDTLKYVSEKSKATGINVLPISSITLSQKGDTLVDFFENAPHCIAFSEDGLTVNNSKIMYDALNMSNKVCRPIFAHCEDHFLKNNGQINEGEVSKKLGLKGINRQCEDVIISRDILLAEENSSKLHICHVSTYTSLEILKNGKEKNKNLTAEVCPHHFVLTDEDIKELDSNFKMAPPLRAKKDVLAMRDALKNDVIDVIATDHAPHSKEEKEKDFNDAPNGIVGLETLVPLTITHLVNKSVISRKQFVEKTSLNPAKIINIDKGTLSVNKTADITIIDVTTPYKIQVDKFKSKSKNSPFDNFEVFGLVTHTIANGNIVFERNSYDNW